MNSSEEVIVSLTSFPKAIFLAKQAIESILKGSLVPDKIVLYLTFSEFTDIKIPEDLILLSKNNPIFEIRNFSHNIRSYRKLIPALIDFPQAIIVTIDDDVYYHKHMLRDLLNLHAKFPNAVIAHRAKRIKIGKPYKTWKKYRWYDFLFKRIHINYKNLQTGVGGVLYPPNALKPEMLDEKLFTKIAPTTDDIWFWASAVLNGYPIIPVPFGKNKPKGLDKPKEISLKTTNFKGKTDRNLQALNNIITEFPEIKEKISLL